ncbi:MAG: APH(3') family aminoglycoside O-phosphotransferase [Ktedonobacteraceae bacterium]
MMSIDEVPVDMRRLLAGSTLHPVSIGESGDQVFRIVRPDGTACYLKIADSPWQREELLAEKEHLEWLQGRLAVPEVYGFSTDNERTFLLLSEIPGLESCDKTFERDIPIVVRLLAEGLQLIHRVEIVDCPFDRRLDHMIALAKRRVEAGLIDEADFDEQRKGTRARELLELLIKSQPEVEDAVFTHGDYCLPNILIESSPARIAGFIDWGRAGIADRYQDLALATRSLAYNFGPGWEPLLWEAYGLQTVDPAKIEFYKLLDEFF